MSITAGDLITEAAAIYQDVEYDRVEVEDWARYLTAAIKRLVGLRPDAHYKTVAIKLTGTAPQTLPEEAVQLIEVIRNMGEDGATAGSPITEVDKDTLNRTLSWYAESTEPEVEHYSYDPRRPKNFTVSPPSNNYIEVAYSYLPPAVTGIATVIDVTGTFETDLLNWMLYMAYSIDSDEANSWQRAQFYMQAFFTGIGIEKQLGEESTGEK